MKNLFEEFAKEASRLKTANRVAALEARRREQGLKPCKVWIPADSVHHFQRLALLERIRTNTTLPTDLEDQKKLVLEPDLFGVVPQPNNDELLAKLREVVKAASESAHPTSPRWEYGRRLLKQLKEVLDE